MFVYLYLVSYHFVTPDGEQGFSNINLKRSRPIKTAEDIEGIEQEISTANTIHLLYISRLRVSINWGKVIYLILFILAWLVLFAALFAFQVSTTPIFNK